MKKNRWKKGIALFLNFITAIFTGSMIPVQASEYWPQAPETISVCDGDGDEHGSCII